LRAFSFYLFSLQLGVEGAPSNGETNLIASVSVDGTVSNFLEKPLLSSDSPIIEENMLYPQELVILSFFFSFFLNYRPVAQNVV
jgi:hypothetical protein